MIKEHDMLPLSDLVGNKGAGSYPANQSSQVCGKTSRKGILWLSFGVIEAWSVSETIYQKEVCQPRYLQH